MTTCANYSPFAMLLVTFLLLLVLCCKVTLADFIYEDFNNTVGLVFNGAAASTDCNESSAFIENDSVNQASSKLQQHGSTTTQDVFSTVETIQHNSLNDEIATHNAVFGHRTEFEVGTATGCSSRLRLTPSHPSKSGSIWYESRVSVVSSGVGSYVARSSSSLTTHETSTKLS